MGAVCLGAAAIPAASPTPGGLGRDRGGLGRGPSWQGNARRTGGLGCLPTYGCRSFPDGSRDEHCKGVTTCKTRQNEQVGLGAAADGSEDECRL